MVKNIDKLKEQHIRISDNLDLLYSSIINGWDCKKLMYNKLNLLYIDYIWIGKFHIYDFIEKLLKSKDFNKQDEINKHLTHELQKIFRDRTLDNIKVCFNNVFNKPLSDKYIQIINNILINL